MQTLANLKMHFTTETLMTTNGTRNYYFAKRVFDFTVVALSLFFIFPLLALLWILIKLDSEGPALYTQTRVGARPRFGGNKIFWETQEFTIYKFRTMKTGASSKIHREFIEAYIKNDEAEMARLQQISCEEKSKFKLNGDPRVTRVGKFLRKTSLDELPQLLNVLQGNMSLVGPRPPIPYEVEMYERRHRRRLSAMPGMTGLWQVKGRSSIGFQDMVDLDVEYIDNQSFWYDFKILVMTIPAVLLNREAE